MTRPSTYLGTLGSPARALVDTAGWVELEDGARVGWWVGGEDRWHLPEHEVAVRQQLVGEAPVVETSMRIPSGDAVQRAWAVPSGEGALVLMEIENRSPVPVAVAFVVPHPAGAEPARLLLPTGPLRAHPSSVDDVTVVVFPLPHSATVRVGIPLQPTDDAVLPDGLPTATAVAKGWEAQGGRGIRVELPEPTVAAVLDATRRQLLLAERGDGRLVGGAEHDWAQAGPIAVALDRLGLAGEAERLLLGLPDGLGSRGALDGGDPLAAPAHALLAVGAHAELTGDGDFAAGFVEVAAALAEGLRHRTRGRRAPTPDPATARLVADAFAAAARLFEQVGEARAAADARADEQRVRAGDPGRADPDLTDLALMATAAAGLRVWPGPDGRPDLVHTADFVGRALDLLLHATETGLVLAPGAAPGWYGQGWEVHEAPTRFGRFSYAVRWHGARPALLWQLESHREQQPAPRLVAPTLDPAWSSDESRGEALLAPVVAPDAGSIS